jgi:cytoskeletal protein CcmA (bactofilin family)
VRTGGPIRGDFGAAGGKVSLDEPVAGDAWLAAGSAEVHAPVGERLRVAGGEVKVDSAIGGKLTAAAGQLTIGPSAAIGGTATLYAGRAVVDGRIDGDLHATARQLTINGQVGGDVDAQVDTIELGPGARIGGTLRYAARTELRQAEGATVGSIVKGQRDRRAERDQVVIERSWQFPGSWPMGGLAALLSLVASAAIFLLLVPRYAAHAADRLADGPLGAVALGVVVVLMVPVVAVLLCVTVLGIPLGLLLLAVYPVLLLAGYFIGVLAIARRLAAALRKPQPTGFAGTFGWFALALVLAVLAGLVPGLGKLAMALLVLGGSGAAVIELQHRRKGGGPTASRRQIGAGLA